MRVFSWLNFLQKYGLERAEDKAFNRSFTAQHYQRVLKYVQQHFAETITIEDLAREAGLSTSHFARLFKHTIGTSPHQFVMSFRVEQARALMQATDNSQVEIALSCGFSDQAHFSRVFKQFTSQTPRQFRQISLHVLIVFSCL